VPRCLQKKRARFSPPKTLGRKQLCEVDGLVFTPKPSSTPPRVTGRSRRPREKVLLGYIRSNCINPSRCRQRIKLLVCELKLNNILDTFCISPPPIPGGRRKANLASQCELRRTDSLGGLAKKSFTPLVHISASIDASCMFLVQLQIT